LRATAFTKRGTSGIRSSVLDRMGKFVPDTMVMWQDSSVHVLNYNSPGATGALPMAAKIASRIMDSGAIAGSEKPRSLWDATAIAEQMRE
jgi:(S)-2-hydroxyglutarate dehydrogenase